MRILPRGKSELIAFLQHRAPIWSADPAAIGLTAAQAAQVTSAASAAAQQRAEVKRLQNELAAAISAQDAAIAEARRIGGQAVRIISAFAAITDDRGVYAAAQIPAPTPPAPIHPEAPGPVRFTLQSDGSLLLVWAGSRRGSQSFAIRRSVTMPGAPPAPYEPLAYTDRRRYIDRTIPAGAAGATYQISALKGGREAPGVAMTASFVYEAPAPSVTSATAAAAA
ncbi:MAG: hypothetical protein ACF8R7_08660 [Phycisphaerales bacterium JB039]